MMIAMLLVLSCTGQQKKADVAPSPTVAMTLQEQNSLAMKKFSDMLEITKNARRQDVLVPLMDGYREIINKYPDSSLAQESYYRLMLMNLQDFDPPRETEAEKIYREYFAKYPKPRLGMTVNGELARYYYQNGKWEKLASFTTPFMREYVKSGKYGDTVFLFLYTEAKYHLGDYKEARKGYLTIKRLFPNSSDARLSDERLKVIDKKRKGTGN